MKKYVAYSITCIVVLTLMTACASRPETEIAAAQAAVQAVLADGGDKYLPDQTAQVSENLKAALDEVSVQDGKFLKSYGKAVELLTKAKTNADALRPSVAEAKQQARNEAEAGFTAAEAAVQEASSLISTAPKGKGSMADLEALRSDIKGLEDSLPEVQDMIGKEEFIIAREKAEAITKQANDISQEIRTAMEKVKGFRKKLS